MKPSLGFTQQLFLARHARSLSVKSFLPSAVAVALILGTGTGCLSVSADGAGSVTTVGGTTSDSGGGSSAGGGSGGSSGGSATVTIGPPASIAVDAGNSQSGTVGAALSTPLSVVVKDAQNQVVSGVTVNWAVASGSGTLGSATSVTNSSGVASNTVTLGTAAGALSITATVQGTGITTSLSATAVAGSAAAISVSSGNNQTAGLSSALGSPLAALVVDSHGNPVSGVTINWAVSSGTGTLGGATSTSNASGVASNTFTTPASAGATTVTATVNGTGFVTSFTATATLCSGAYLTNTPFAAGDGSAGNPYLICTASQLNNIGADATLVTKHYQLGVSIDLSGVTVNPIGSSAQGFRGNFNGDNYTLSNLSLTASANEVGLFRRVLSGATIRNLTIRGGTIAGGSYNEVGALVGRGNDIYGNYDPVTITNVHVTEMTITGTRSVGGLVGYSAVSLKISLSSSTKNTISATSYAGGIGGEFYGSGGINTSYSMSNVTASGNYAGGLLGHWNYGSNGDLNGTMHNCYATHDGTYGTVTAANYAGGLVGNINNNATMFMSFSTAPVVSGGANKGGIAGAGGGTCTSCYWDITTSGQATSTVGIGKTTAQMKSLMYLRENGFGGAGNYVIVRYDFANTWRLESSNHYPSFQWQHPGYSVTLAGLLPEGSGTAGDPYIISSVERLENMAIAVQGFAGARTAHYKLTANLDLSGKYLPMIGGLNYNFRGTFDGDSHTLSNLSYAYDGSESAGLFATAGHGATIKNLTLSGVSITGTARYVGALVGLAYNGGVCCGGWGNSLTIQNVHVTGATISGSTAVGGIVGGQSSNEVVMTSSGVVDSTINGTTQVGGVVGAAIYGSYSKVYARATVTASGNEAGGLIGRYQGTVTISDSYATHDGSFGTVTGVSSVGGLIGNGAGGTLARVFASNPVVGTSNTGGLVGSNAPSCGSASCFWDTDTSGQATSPVGAAKTTAEMFDASTFTGAGWNGTTVWSFSGTDYPALR